MFIAVTKDTEESHCAFSQDSMKGLMQSGCHESPMQGRFYLNSSRRRTADPSFLKDPRCSSCHTCPEASERSQWGNVSGSAGMLCRLGLEGHPPLGKTWRKESFVHIICWCGWVEACLYLTSCTYVSVSTAGLSVDSTPLL